VSVTASASVLNGKMITWTRNVETEGGRTRYEKAKPIKDVSALIQKNIRENGQSLNIPLVAYYSTERYKKETYDTGVEAEGSRLRGYFHALNTRTNLQFFLNLFRTQEFAALQKGAPSEMLVGVRTAVETCIEDCSRIYHHIERDELIVLLKNGKEIPFKYLSDGVRSMLAMVMEIAFRCCLLNRHLGASAPLETPGVVLIDELDLHLHPSWQKKVIADLRHAFPKIQFFASTHAPLIIGGMQAGKIITLKDNQAFTLTSQYGHDANSILLEMETDERQTDVKNLLQRYHLLIEAGEGENSDGISVRSQLEQMLGKNDPEIQRADVMLALYS
jgi:predicted ATP-binding protein involved in virulence